MNPIVVWLLSVLGVLFLIAQIIGAIKEVSWPISWVGRQGMILFRKRAKKWPVEIKPTSKPKAYYVEHSKELIVHMNMILNISKIGNNPIIESSLLVLKSENWSCEGSETYSPMDITKYTLFNNSLDSLRKRKSHSTRCKIYDRDGYLKEWFESKAEVELTAVLKLNVAGFECEADFGYVERIEVDK